MPLQFQGQGRQIVEKTERGEKKKGGGTTNKPIPDELKRMEAAIKIKLPRLSSDSTVAPLGSVTGVRHMPGQSSSSRASTAVPTQGSRGSNAGGPGKTRTCNQTDRYVRRHLTRVPAGMQLGGLFGAAIRPSLAQAGEPPPSYGKADPFLPLRTIGRDSEPHGRFGLEFGIVVILHRMGV
jgi:hypothetical protein